MRLAFRPAGPITAVRDFVVERLLGDKERRRRFGFEASGTVPATLLPVPIWEGTDP